MFNPAHISKYIIPAYIDDTNYNERDIMQNLIPYNYYTFPDEIFLPITDNIIPGVAPYYYISNYGRVWSDYGIGKFCSFVYDRKLPYARVKLAIYGSKNGRRYYVHRLVMLTFCPIQNPENYQVNHKDGCVINNCLYNLEWVSRLENMRHSFKYLHENDNRNFISQEDAFMIGILLYENKLSFSQIANIVGCNKSTIRNINSGSCHKDIYDYFNLGSIKRDNRTLSNDDVYEIRKMLEKGIPIINISRELGISEHIISSIKRRKTYKDV